MNRGSDGAYGFAYSFNMDRMVQMHDSNAEALGGGWVDGYEASGMNLRRYLDTYANEVYESFDRDRHDIIDYPLAGSIKERIEGERLTAPGGRVDNICNARDNSPAYNEYLLSQKEDITGLAFVAYADRFLLYWSSAADGSTWHSEAVARLSPNVAVAQAMRGASDFWLLRKGIYARGVEEARFYASAGSSRAAQIAINGALDRKLLMNALRDRSNDYQGTRAMLVEQASSSEARDAMLSYVAGLATKGATTSRPGNRNYKWSTSERINEEHKSKATIDFTHELIARLRSQGYGQGSKEKPSESHTARPKPRPEVIDVDAIIRKAPLKFHTSLRSVPREELHRVIVAVHEFRKDKPDLPPRRVYGHFHIVSQHEQATVQDRNTVSILALLMGGNVGKTAALPF